MAASPEFKVYVTDKYLAACHEAVAATVLADWYGPQATVRRGHAAKWTLYRVADDCTLSLDERALRMSERRKAVQQACWRAAYPPAEGGAS